MNRKPLILSIITSVVLIIFLWNVCPQVVKGVDRIIYSYGYPIPTWILFHGIFALSFGLIPFFSSLIWCFGGFTSSLSLIAHALFAYTLALVVSGYIFVHYAESTKALSPFLPRYTPAQSSWGEYVMNLAIPISVFFPLLLLLVVAFIKRSKVIQTRELDQSLDS